MADLTHIVRNFGSPRILVLGDLILDRYLWGEVDRISPEAPIVVLRATREEVRIGGAGSVMKNLVILGASVSACGVLGDDGPGETYRKELGKSGVETAGVFRAPDRQTTVKTRMIARSQHVLRVDEENTEPLTEPLVSSVSDYLTRSLPAFDIVLVSDYDKGLLRHGILPRLIENCRRQKKPCLIDPARGVDYSLYRGSTLISPNRLEAEMASGLKIKSPREAEAAARALRERCDIEAVVITLDREGISLLDSDDRFLHFPTRARTVYDVTGAGDMVLSILGIALASRASLPDAVALANVAGGIEVERFGVTPITKREIIHELLDEGRYFSKKVRDADELESDLEEHRLRGEKIVFTNGCFDLLHVGHLKFLEFARKQGSVLVVAINSDRSVRALKGKGRPILLENERAHLLAALACVDYVTVFDEETPMCLIERFKPDVLVKGEDWKEKGVVGSQFVESYGGKVILAPLVEGISTTEIVSRILDRNSTSRSSGGEGSDA